MKLAALVAGCALVLATGRASADDTAKRVAAVKAMLAAQNKAYIDNDEKAFKATLAPDAAISFNGSRPTDGWVFVGGGLQISSVAIKDVRIGWSGSWGWVAADLRIKSVLLSTSSERKFSQSSRCARRAAALSRGASNVRVLAAASPPRSPSENEIFARTAPTRLAHATAPPPSRPHAPGAVRVLVEAG